VIPSLSSSFVLAKRFMHPPTPLGTPFFAFNYNFWFRLWLPGSIDYLNLNRWISAAFGMVRYGAESFDRRHSLNLDPLVRRPFCHSSADPFAPRPASCGTEVPRDRRRWAPRRMSCPERRVQMGQIGRFQWFCFLFYRSVIVAKLLYSLCQHNAVYVRYSHIIYVPEDPTFLHINHFVLRNPIL
jgi:hypothetical protein